MSRADASSSPAARFIRAGDSAIVVEFEERIEIPISARCVALADAVRRWEMPGIRDVVPAYRAVTVYFDPLRTGHARLVEQLKRAVGEASQVVASVGQTHRIPVCYGGAFGPDLADVARFGGLSEAQAVARHATPSYHVFMLGFVPGFAYLGPVDGQIAAPRRSTPRTRVPAGSVALASGQTAIYPVEIPGGWQLIGRTPLTVFDASRPRPSLFEAGDVVQFFSIGQQEWDRYTS
jgi:inhibitor of KinA